MRPCQGRDTGPSPVTRSRNMNIDTVTLNKPLSITIKFAIAILAFLIPFIIPSPQWLTGSLVNCLFYLLAFSNISRKELLPYAVIPSIGAISNGLLFGSLTIYLFYIMPFIWLSNIILISTVQRLKYNNFLFRIALSSLLKYIFLFIFTVILFRLKFVPQLFITTMGPIQLFTAITGGFLSLAILKIITRINE